MKHLLGVLAFATLVGGAQAATFTFTPNDNSGDADDLFDLDHHYAYTWGIQFDIPVGQQITGATLRIDNIWDWRPENDMLFIHLLDDPSATNSRLVRSIEDNTNDTVISDYFGPNGLLTTWSDPVGGVNNGFDLVYSFTAAQLATLTSYVTDSRPTDSGSTRYGDFGIGFDPDCHYYNTGIKLTITTGTSSVPDGGATVVLAGGAMLVLAAFRKKRA